MEALQASCAGTKKDIARLLSLSLVVMLGTANPVPLMPEQICGAVLRAAIAHVTVENDMGCRGLKSSEQSSHIIAQSDSQDL